MEHKCYHNGEYKKYDKTFDAYFCQVCNIWLEPICRDPECLAGCQHRPEKPSQVKGRKMDRRIKTAQKHIEKVEKKEFKGMLKEDKKLDKKRDKLEDEVQHLKKKK